MRLIKSHASLFLPFVILLVPRQKLHIVLIQLDAGFAAGHIIYTYCRKNSHGNRNTANNSSHTCPQLRITAFRRKIRSICNIVILKKEMHQP